MMGGCDEAETYAYTVAGCTSDCTSYMDHLLSLDLSTDSMLELSVSSTGVVFPGKISIVHPNYRNQLARKEKQKIGNLDRILLFSKALPHCFAYRPVVTLIAILWGHGYRLTFVTIGAGNI
jgi:hypothetical protein